MSRDVMQRLWDTPIIALRCRGEAWPRGLLTPPLIPDTWMGLVQAAGGGRRFVPAGEDPRPQRDDTVVLVRNRSITVPLEVNDVPAAGGHAVRGTVEALLRCPAREDDLAALCKALLADEELTLEQLARAVEDAGASIALRGFVREHEARQLVHDDVRDALCDHLRKALERFLFSTGLILERLGRVEFTSRSLAEHEAIRRETARRVREMESRDVVQNAALAAAHRRLDNLGDILTKLKNAAAGDVDVQWRELLPSLTPGERGRLLENLWRLTPDRKVAEAIVVVAGRECVWLDPPEPERIARQVTLSEELGGLRSVTYDARRDTLWVGAATGLWNVDPQTGETRERYVVPNAQSPRTGFNAAVSSRGQLFATHSQLGAWSWRIDDPTDVQPLLQPVAGVPRTIRAITTDERKRVLLAADDRVHAFDLAGETAWQTAPAGGTIRCLAALEEWVYVGTASGALLRSDLNLRDAWLPVHRAYNPIESISARRWDDLIELVIPAGREGVFGVYAEEGIVSRLLDAPVALRRTWACDDTLVALSDSRDRLVVLNGTMPARTGHQVPIKQMLGWSIQDACVVMRQGEKGIRGS